MSIESDPLGVQWVVACLAPADVAPHPNFRTDHVSEPELLALVIRFQWREYMDYRDPDEEADHSDAGEGTLADAALKSLRSETILVGIEGLREAVKNNALALGARASAALIMASANAEIDQPEKTIPILDDLIWTISSSGAGSEGSRSLIVAGLLQQCALRYFEIGAIEQSRQYASRVVDTLALSEAGWDEFSVSRGISWNAVESQRRLAELLLGNARSLLAHTADLNDNSWVDVVRSPFPAAAVRQTRDMETALAGIAEETFKRSYNASTRTRVFNQADTALALAYSSMLNAELTGDISRTARYQKTLGGIFAIRLVNGADDPEWPGEAIRLFRQADAHDDLKRFLQHVREQGPLDTLSRAAENLIDTRKSQRYVTASDLLLLEKAADLIAPERAVIAVQLALDYARLRRPGRLKDQNAASWTRTETAISTIASLASVDSGLHVSSALSDVIEVIATSKAVRNQFAFSALTKLVGHIDWSSVSRTTRGRLLAAVEAAASPKNVLSTDHLRIYKEMGEAPPLALVESLSGFEFVVALLDGTLDHSPTVEDLDRAVDIVGRTLSEDRQDAARGTRHGYFWSPFGLAALLISDHGRNDLWPPLLDALLDSNVSAEHKVDALDVLAKRSSASKLPDSVREVFRLNRIPGGDGLRDAFFPTSIDRLNISCRNFYIAHDLLGAEEVLEETLRDSRANETTIRAEAAKGCLLVGSRNPDVDWPIIVASQLSFDRESFVRHRAAHVLAYLSMVSNLKLKAVVKSRVRELLGDPGISPPMGVLRGLIAYADDVSLVDQPLWCEREVRKLLDSHPSRNIRAAARSVLAKYLR
ncbi:hypothetical protein ACFYUV_24705 [Nonomuraea sp. NPDC003560]|uniref:hypothetical protein n=1 Tax=Nonomuraea sp. NPDC003560 TaxID=3364341 RepID=UPI0036C2868B